MLRSIDAGCGDKVSRLLNGQTASTRRLFTKPSREAGAVVFTVSGVRDDLDTGDEQMICRPAPPFARTEATLTKPQTPHASIRLLESATLGNCGAPAGRCGYLFVDRLNHLGGGAHHYMPMRVATSA